MLQSDIVLLLVHILMLFIPVVTIFLSILDILRKNGNMMYDGLTECGQSIRTMRSKVIHLFMEILWR